MHWSIDAIKQVLPIFLSPTGTYPNPAPLKPTLVAVIGTLFLYSFSSSYIEVLLDFSYCRELLLGVPALLPLNDYLFN